MRQHPATGRKGPIAQEFLWGAATSAYQIEGSPLADGAGESIWDRFVRRPGAIRGGDTAQVACDHYRRCRDDLEEMARLGLQAYRFSVAWPRVVPEDGKVNPRGLDFYDRLVDGLLDKGITPFCTLFHWETPLWLERRGGFARREAVEALCRYGELVSGRLGDRVKHWITINEPLVYATYGYLLGRYAPGRRWRPRRVLAASHHLLLGHCRLVALLHAAVPRAAVGIAQHQVWVRPLNPERPRDRRAAGLADQLINRWYMGPLFRGEYPAELVERVGRWLPRGYERDLEEMRRPGDFVGLNYYQVRSYRHCPWVPVVHARQAPTPGAAPNDLGWEVDPEGLHGLLRRLKDEYGNPDVYVTENGFPTVEPTGGGAARGAGAASTGGLEDPQRIAYLDGHLRAVARARLEGARVKGYFVWSLMDNFEWAEGYRARFGLLRVDFDTQVRSWRASARWYRERIRAGAPEVS